MMRCEVRAIALAACLVCCAASAFAAETATIQQTGSNGNATINQMENAGNVESVIAQSGGSGNAAVITQLAIIDTDMAAAAQASIAQHGSGNSALLSQSGTDMQGASISQTGNDNRATLTAFSGRASVGIIQSGNANGADVTFDTSRSGLAVLQSGNNNYARVSEHNGAFFEVSASMNGNSNSAYIDVSGGWGIVTANQTGDHNELHITQNTQDAMGFENNTATITQATSFNFASIAQVGAGMTATIVQDTGNHNTASINQHF